MSERNWTVPQRAAIDTRDRTLLVSGENEKNAKAAGGDEFLYFIQKKRDAMKENASLSDT